MGAQASYMEQAMLMSHANRAAQQMEVVTGIAGLVPKFQLPNPPVRIGSRIVNNINVSNSNVGVINTGNVARIKASLKVVAERGDDRIAASLALLTEEVRSIEGIAIAAREQILEHIEFVAEQAARDPEQRQASLGSQCLRQLDELLSPLANLATLWQSTKPSLIPLFAAFGSS